MLLLLQVTAVALQVLLTQLLLLIQMLLSMSVLSFTGATAAAIIDAASNVNCRCY